MKMNKGSHAEVLDLNPSPELDMSLTFLSYIFLCKQQPHDGQTPLRMNRNKN
jgi:hypothetical protein